MALYLVHHGEAVWPDVDPMRPLSERGRAEVGRLAEAVVLRGVKPAVVWHSGKLRARQTAEIFWRVCNPLAELKATRGLQLNDPPRWIRDKLAGEERAILLVGHMPHLPRLLRTLCGEDPDNAAIEFPLHGCVALEPDRDRWTEIWRLEP